MLLVQYWENVTQLLLDKMYKKGGTTDISDITHFDDGKVKSSGK